MRLDHLLSKDNYGIQIFDLYTLTFCSSVLKVHFYEIQFSLKLVL